MEQNEKQQFQCSGDCIKCLPVQRQYCAAQHAYNSMMMLQKMQDAFEQMSKDVGELKTKVAAIQDNEALVFNPNDDTSQNGDGEDE